MQRNCFIILDAGVNHNGSVELAKKLVDAAVEAGADAVKFQTFKADKIVTREAKQADYQVKNTGKRESQYNMLRKLELSYDDFKTLKKYCDKKGIMFLSTPHSCKEDVDLVARLCPIIKIASGDLTNIPFLKYVAKIGKPMLLSTGMGTLEEVMEAVRVICPFNTDLILLHCTSEYPASLNEVNLKAMVTMKNEFNVRVGYSDHTKGILASVIAVAMGASVIEKHLTLSNDMVGPDHTVSLTPDEAKVLVKEIRKVELMLGDGVKKPTLSECSVMKVVRKSVVVVKDIKKGTIIKKNMLAIMRPGTGIHPRDYDVIIGKIAKRDIKKGTLMKWGWFDDSSK